MELCLRLPLEYIPDPRTVIEDEIDRQRFEREIAERMKRQEEERLIKLAENLARKEERAKKKEEMLAAKMNGGQDSDGLDGLSGSDKDSKSGSKSKDGSDSKNKTGSKRTGSANESGSNS